MTQVCRTEFCESHSPCAVPDESRVCALVGVAHGGQMRESRQIVGGFAGLDAPSPFLANRSLEAEFEDDVEGVIGVLENCAKYPIELSLAQILVGNFPCEVDVAMQ